MLFVYQESNRGLLHAFWESTGGALGFRWVSAGGLLVLLSLGEDRVTPWTTDQVIAGPHRDKHWQTANHSHRHLWPLANSHHIHVVGLWEEDGEGERAQHRENMQTPRRKTQSNLLARRLNTASPCQSVLISCKLNKVIVKLTSQMHYYNKGT